LARQRATDPLALVAAAAETFHRKGYRNSTIDDIAAAAGISRPTVYKYTQSKQQLLDAMVTHVTDGLHTRIQEVLRSGEPAVARLRAMISVHIESAIANRTVYAIVFSEEVELSKAGRERFRRWARERTREFRDLLDECLAEQPAPPPIDTRVAANLVVSMLSTLYRWYDPDGPVAPAALAEQIELLLAPLLAPDPG
jgi:AcrR family transcriptional regulator